MSGCPHFGPCGGCRFLDTDYAAQLPAKHAQVVAALAGHALLRAAAVRPVLADPEPFCYRNKAIYPVQQHAGKLVAGFYRRGSHAIVDVHACLIQDPALTEMANRLRALIAQRRLPIYDEHRHHGLLRAMHLRVATTGELMVGLVTTAGELRGAEELCEQIHSASRGLSNRARRPVVLVAIVRNINDGKTNVILGRRTIVCFGRSFLRDAIGRITVRVSLASFYQVNPTQAAAAYRLALELAGDARHDLVVDAYAGIGTMALWYAPHARQVIGLEDVADAVRDASANARDNGFPNCRFHLGRVEHTLRLIDGAIDLLLLDPPRSGCSPAALAAVITKQPRRIVYLSCSPRAFARDAALLASQGYQLEVVQPIDFFPHTEHIEVLAAFTRRW